MPDTPKTKEIPGVEVEKDQRLLMQGLGRWAFRVAVIGVPLVLLAMAIHWLWPSHNKSPTAAAPKSATSAECPGKREKITANQEEWLDLKGCRLVADDSDLKRLKFKDRDGNVMIWPLKSKPEELQSQGGVLVFRGSLCRDDHTSKKMDYDCTYLEQTAQTR